MGYINKDIPYTEFQGMLVPLPFFEDKDGKLPQIKGDKAPYIQLIGPDGNPISISSPLPVNVQGATIEAGSLTVGDMQSKTVDVTFHDAATAVGEGTAFNVLAYKTLTVEIYGTSTARDIKFYGKSASGVKRPIMGVNLADLSMAISTINNNEIWSFEVTGLQSVIMEITSVSGGNVSIKGKAVA
jgi:hypothetical protein